MGTTDGAAAFDGQQPAVAYNTSADEFLVVWRGNDDGIAGLDGSEVEVFGQRFDAATDAEIGGDDFLISAVGGTGVANGRGAAGAPAVAWASTSNVYLVVWSGDDSLSGLADDEFEIFGRCVDGATGAPVGSNFRISDMGPDGSADYDAVDPDVAYNAMTNEFLVVWSGDDDTGALLDDEFEIYAQRVDAPTCAETGVNDVRVSAMQPSGSADYDANAPAVAVNSSDGNYLVVWSGDQFILGTHVDEDFEIHGQLLTALGVETGADDFRLSNMGVDGTPEGTGLDPDVVHNGVDNEYLVVWSGDWPMHTVVAVDKFDIHAQRLTAGGAEVGPDDARISRVGGPTYALRNDAITPAVAHSAVDNTYLVAFAADGEGVSGQPADDELEIHLQPLGVSGDDEFYLYDFRLTSVGIDGDTTRAGSAPALAFGAADGRYLLVWQADDSDFGSPALADDEFEVFGVRLRIPGFYVLDSWGGVHVAYGPALPGPASPYFGFDIARDFEIVANGYYVLDGFGGVHTGGGASPVIPGTPFFGFDVARDLEATGTGGLYVLDGYGGVHAAGGAPQLLPATPYFGFDIARDFELVETGGYVVLEGFGGVHSGGGANVPFTTTYWGIDRGRDIEMAPVGYYVMHDGGSILAGNGAPDLQPSGWPSALTTPPARDFELVPGGALVLDGEGTVYAVVTFWPQTGGHPPLDKVVVPAFGFVTGAAVALELR